jgi:hypothetical protein
MTASKPIRKWLVTGAIAGGALLGAAGIASAATGTSSSADSTASNTATAVTPAAAASDPATMTHGPGETLLTGTTAEKVKAAALAAVPGGTIIRVETDSGGAAYEAHMTKADGSNVTVKLDSNFKVTATEDGFGAGGPRGAAPTNA